MRYIYILIFTSVTFKGLPLYKKDISCDVAYEKRSASQGMFNIPAKEAPQLSLQDKCYTCTFIENTAVETSCRKARHSPSVSSATACGCIHSTEEVVTDVYGSEKTIQRNTHIQIGEPSFSWLSHFIYPGRVKQCEHLHYHNFLAALEL